VIAQFFYFIAVLSTALATALISGCWLPVRHSCRTRCGDKRNIL